MFEKLQHEVDLHNEKYASQGGKVLLQWYERNHNEYDSESDTEKSIPIKKRPLVLVLCTPLMR